MLSIKQLLSYSIPTSVRLCACSLCQLSCPACDTHFELDKKNVLGRGYLRAKDFRRFVDNNPQVKEIELSHSGEIFLNPELEDIIRYAFEKDVALTAGTGVNLNNISRRMCESLVKYNFKLMKVSIDGANEKIYAMYRKGGSYSRVIENIKLINHFKKVYKSNFPIMQWQFIPFGHNEHQISLARKKATVLGMDFVLKLNAKPNFSPLKNIELVRKQTGLQAVTREEYKKEHGNVFALSCHELWTAPQINWDGKLLGCCSNLFVDMGNVFKSGLPKLLKSQRYLHTKQVVLGLKVPSKNIPCYWCLPYTEEATKQEIVRSTVTALLKHGTGSKERK